MILNLTACILMLLGSGFMFLAALGLCRMPDLYTRMHAAAKVGTVGIICVMGSVILVFRRLDISAKAGLIILFFLLTIPIAGHMIGRAAFLTGIPFWKNTRINEWEEGFNQGRGPADPNEG